MKYIFSAWCLFMAFISVGQGTVSAVPTFNCMSLYATGVSSGQVQYRETGSSVWLSGLDLWQDSRAINGRPSGEYRGSVVGLKPGTSYDFQVGSATVTASTLSETFPVGSTGTVSGTISSGGTSSAYKLYTGNYNGGVTIDAPYVILRGCKLTGASDDAIVLTGKAHHVVIENCDISGWGQPASTLGGNNEAAIRTKFTSSTTNLVIQRNFIHNPRYSASGWSTETAGDHPYGVNAINLEGSGGGHIIRYNTIVSDSVHPESFRFMDGIGGADNFTYTGAPGQNSDIYGNIIVGCFDDGIEAEGGGMNVRIWGNFTNYTFTGIATATVSVGPMYVFNNVSNVGMRMSYVNSTEDRGPFNKCGGNNQAQYTGGRTYLFNNTVLQPSGNRGLCGGIVESGGKVTNFVSINNIWTSPYTSKGGYPINLFQGGSGTSINDLFSPNTTGGSVTKSGSITGTPSYNSSLPLSLDPNGYFLSSGSPGKGKAAVINNFNDQLGADVGAYNKSKLQFGVTAYLTIDTTVPPPLVNKPPTANSSATIYNLTLPANSTSLIGSGSDPDGSIVSYQWSKVSGPSSFTFSNPAAASTTVSNLVQGVYGFQLTVTDNSGASGSSIVNITVNPAVPPPPQKTLIRVEISTKAVYSDSTSQTTLTIIK